MGNIGFISYAVTILFVAGLLLLLIDVKGYKNAGLKKERKVTLILGWTNLSLSIILTLTAWIYRTWIW
ncbi:CLC_0170 family protein [Peribacillus asahii]|uniref:CLC_0170 family protein n=1 Tax=Peribacillus asahii TaxID=228899 RepID=UPI00380E8710